MSVLGIITCEILELEFAHILGKDSELGLITILEDSRSARMIEALESMRIRNLRRIPHIRGFFPEPPISLEVIVRVLDFSLHSNKKTLRQALIQAAREMRPYMDSLLLGYGLCGNTFEKPEQLPDLDIPLFIPMDKDHPVDDCVGLLIGGRDIYHVEQCRTPGTFFMIPGWTYHWKRIFDREFCGGNPAMAKRIFAAYERSLMVLTPTMTEKEMKENTEAFNTLFNLRIESRKGTLSILYETWNAAKASLKLQNPRT